MLVSISSKSAFVHLTIFSIQKRWTIVTMRLTRTKQYTKIDNLNDSKPAGYSSIDQLAIYKRQSKKPLDYVLLCLNELAWKFGKFAHTSDALEFATRSTRRKNSNSAAAQDREYYKYRRRSSQVACAVWKIASPCIRCTSSLVMSSIDAKCWTSHQRT